MAYSDRHQVKTRLMQRLYARLAAPPYCGAPRLVLAVSGGRDSCVLLDVFWRMRHVHGAELKVLHVDHHTGAHAKQARALVKARCADLGVPLEIADFHWDGQGNFERAASQFRRDRLQDLCGETGYAVLAHHRGDQSETLMMALTRGAGVASPLGMVQQRERRLRPLLDLPVAWLAEHAQATKLTWCEDPSNRDPERFRNAVRHQVLPALSTFHEDAGGRMSEWLEEYQVLQGQLDTAARQCLKGDVMQPAPGGGWLLKRHVFQEAAPYLWPFILAVFWEKHGVIKPRRREHHQLMTWLHEGTHGSFDYLGKRLYCDHDALVFTIRPELSPCFGRLNQAMDWGLWRLRLQWLGPDLTWTETLRRDGFQLLAGKPLPKNWRERLRLARMPLRIRQHLPALAVGETSLHFGELFALQAQGYLRVVRESGPDWLC